MAQDITLEFDPSRLRVEDVFDRRRISKIISSGGDAVQALKPLIAYEDNHLLVIFKPPGWLSQGDETGDLSVNEIFAAYLKQKYAKPGNVFCAAVQRLDRPASGLMVLARTSKAAARLSDEIRNRRFIKKYHVFTDKPLPGQGRSVLVGHMKKTERIAKEAVPGEKGSTEYKLTTRLKDMGKSPLCYEVQIETGKFHQIRALFAAHGSPILGDVKYGGRALREHRDRIALIATRVEFEHPTQGVRCIFYLPERSIVECGAYFI